MLTTIAEAAVVDCNAEETIGKILCTMRVSPWYSVYNVENIIHF
jgi:hemolysin-activating ACP:hemolysin acyltransferase